MTDSLLLLTDRYLDATAALLNCVSRPTLDLDEFDRLAAARDGAEGAYLAAARAT